MSQQQEGALWGFGIAGCFLAVAVGSYLQNGAIGIGIAAIVIMIACAVGFLASGSRP